MKIMRACIDILNARMYYYTINNEQEKTMGLPNYDYQYEENELRSLYVESQVDFILTDADDLSETVSDALYGSEDSDPKGYEHILMRLATAPEKDHARYIKEYQQMVRDIVTEKVERETVRRQAS